MVGMHTALVCTLMLALFTTYSQSIEPENKAYDITMKGESGDQGRELKGDDSRTEQRKLDGLPLSEQPSSQEEDDINKVTDQLQELNVGPHDEDIDLSRQTQELRLEQAVKESQHPEPQKKALRLKERQSLEDDNDGSTKGDEIHENVSLGDLDVDVREKLVISSEHADGSLQDAESVQGTHRDSQDGYPAFSDFTIENIIGDGNCFFRAVADQLIHHGFSYNGRILDHHDLRSMACDYLSELPEVEKLEQGEFLDESEYPGRRLEDYIDHMRENGTYADHVVIQALARRFRMQIVIYTDGEPSHIGSNAEQERTIYLHYQRYSPESYSNHYESLHLNDVQGQEKHPTGLTHDEMTADRDGMKTVSKSKGYDSMPPFRTGDLNKVPNINKNQFLKKSKKVLPPSQVSESEKSERVRDIVPRTDAVDGGTESCAVTVSSSQAQTLVQIPMLLSPYKKVTQIISQNEFVQILQERSCPLHIAVSRNILSLPYFHHLIVRAVSDSNNVIDIAVVHSGRLTFWESLDSTHLASVHESTFVVSENGEAPKNLSYFDFDKGVYIIDDFQPHSEDEVNEINKRINESLLNCPYFFSTFNCENFVVFAMTGRTNNTCTQLDYMTTTHRLLADFLDNLIPMNLSVVIVMILCLLFFDEYLLRSVLSVPLSKLYFSIKLKKYVSSEKVHRLIVICVCNISITSLVIYFFIERFLIGTIPVTVHFLTLCFYICMSVFSAIVRPAINSVYNNVSALFSRLGRRLRNIFSTEKTLKGESERNITEIHSENEHRFDRWYMYFIDFFLMRIFGNRHEE